MFRVAALALMLLGCATTAATNPLDAYVGHPLSLWAKRIDAPGAFELAALRGKVVLVDVVTSWCVPCREAVPAWSALRAAVGSDRLEVVAVSVDGERELAESFCEEVAADYPVVWDERGTFVSSYPVEDLPTLFVLDRAGIVRHVHVGFDEDTAAEIERLVRALL